MTQWHGRPVVEAGQLLETARKELGKGSPHPESLRPYLEKAAFFTGAIDELDLGEKKANLIFKKDFGSFEIALVFATFEPRLRRRLEQLSPGQVVTVIGHVDKLQFSKLDLTRCELLAPDGHPEEEAAERPRVLICASGGQSRLAEGLREELAPVADCALWHEGALGLTGEHLDDLIAGIKESDFAVLLLTPEDVTHDALFQLGLLRGILGKGRTFVVHRQDQPLDLPGGLPGITVATFPGDGEDPRAALAPVVGQLKDALHAAA